MKETEISIEKAKGDKHELKPVEEALESSIKVQDTQIKNLEEEIKRYEDGIDRLNRREEENHMTPDGEDSDSFTEDED